MSSFFNSTNLIQILLKWKLHVSIITVVAIALSIFFSSPLFIRPKYRSFAIVYPSNLIPYSSETPTEQMLQLFKSEDIALTVIKKFNLAKHYNIDTSSSTHLSKLKDEFDDNVTIRKSEFESIVIEVYDTDPKVACNLVKEIIELMNLKARQLQRIKTAEVVDIYEQQLIQKQRQIDSIQERMHFLRTEYNLFDYSVQVKEYTKGYVKNIGSGKGMGGSNSEITKMMSNLQEYGGEFLFLGGYLASISSAYNDIKIEYDKSVSDLTKVLTYTNIVTSPYPADKKSYPIRWVIVVGMTLASLFITMLIISFIERRRIRNIS